MEILIQQTKGHKMDILKHLRDPLGKNILPFSHRVEVDEESDKVKLQPAKVGNEGQLIARNIYMFDITSILSVINVLLKTQNKLIGVILKHSDTKTIKFIFRNIFFLGALNVEGPSREIFVKDMEPRSESIL